MKKAVLSLLTAMISIFAQSATAATDSSMTIQLIRSATVKVTVNNKRILTDPILADKGTEAPIPFANDKKNPGIDLPFSRDRVLKEVDAVLLTHYHPDHFDEAAEKMLPKNMLIFCQPGDDIKLQEKGFTNTRVIDSSLTWEGITISRYLASHHKGAVGAPPFGISSSYYLQTGKQSVFFTGDAILDELLTNSLLRTQPPVIVANTGECQFTRENPVLAPGITMTLTTGELKTITTLLPSTTIIAVHMDAINHCSLSKTALRKYITDEKLKSRIVVPNEGDVLPYKQVNRK
ncbi:MBL fold metallo-hydrolase [Chitinophaga flava]|uniref:MBL fold metallo-hydrolase n=1 Tax=Chitinophaga flava TaxID=2259036 RepID=A0A365XUV7_9BACT|nr:MBL fold metallo-hydrolase [Chitinophaga flava]RBL90147.1 hypothetical protein DF182_27150 [Chitinophaga flava]